MPGTASDTLVYDKVGNMVNDGKGLAYKYDGLGRLREVRLTGESNRLKTAYRYNGLGMRITHAINMSEGTSDDDVTDAGDPVTYFAYDERWRVAGAWVSDANTTPSSSTPTERWIHHAAGFGGTGGSSYIDSVVLRDRDVVTSGGTATSTSDGGSDALEERIYVLQNWRADVVATVGRTGTLIEWMQYTAYGSAITNPPTNADFNGDGGVTGEDVEAFFLAHDAGLLSADVNNDGGVDGTDIQDFNNIFNEGDMPSGGLGQVTAIRIGYAGYQWDGSVNVGSERGYTGAMAGLYHVRHRVYDPEMGRWTRRDPIGYFDGMGLYEYAAGRTVAWRDPSGLVSSDCISCLINIVPIGRVYPLFKRLAGLSVDCLSWLNCIRTTWKPELCRGAGAQCGLGLIPELPEIIEKAIGITECRSCLKSLVPRQFPNMPDPDYVPPVIPDDNVPDSTFPNGGTCEGAAQAVDCQTNCQNKATAGSCGRRTREIAVDCAADLITPGEAVARMCQVMNDLGCNLPSICRGEGTQ